MPTYFIHDNGGRPFKVVVTRTRLSVFPLLRYEEETRKWSYHTAPVISFGMRGKKLFVPKQHPRTPSHYVSAQSRFGKGNSLLVRLAPHIYLYIGTEVYVFYAEDTIQEYYSPIGNSDVPYPWAVGRHNVYFMVDVDRQDQLTFVPKSMIQGYRGDPYAWLYKQQNENMFYSKPDTFPRVQIFMILRPCYGDTPCRPAFGNVPAEMRQYLFN